MKPGELILVLALALCPVGVATVVVADDRGQLRVHEHADAPIETPYPIAPSWRGTVQDPFMADAVILAGRAAGFTIDAVIATPA
jgi:hypothetical protein